MVPRPKLSGLIIKFESTDCQSVIDQDDQNSSVNH